MGRYAVQLAQGAPTPLDRYYTFKWELVGNLGVDLLVVPLSKVLGLELAVKCLVIGIQALAALAIVAISREVHGRITPTAYFALPLIYGYPFIFGFINYTLSMSLALAAFVLWLRFQRTNQYWLRALLFVVISPLLWISHVAGWATLCVMCAACELVHQHDLHRRWPLALGVAALQGVALASPLVLMLVWHSDDTAGATSGWFDWHAKLVWIASTLRDRWVAFDLISVAVVLGIIGMAAALLLARSPAIMFSRRLLATGVALLAFFFIVPHAALGAHYVDMRITPYALIVMLLAFRPAEQASKRFVHAFSAVGLLFLGARTVGTTVSFGMLSEDYRQALVALDYVPIGARLVSFVGRSCREEWTTNRMEHLSGLAIVRRQAFSNDQWEGTGAQLIRSRYPQGNELAQRFRRNPSQFVTGPGCKNSPDRPLDWVLANFPRDKFDFVWLIRPPAFDRRLLGGMTLIWSAGPNALYRIDNPPRSGLRATYSPVVDSLLK